jgi:FMN phosphatase YigB (HAD superfamily)
VTSGEVGVQKPDSAIFRLLFDHFQIFDPNLYVHIGDNYKRDYLSATGLGMNALLLAENHPDVPPSHCIKELTDLKLE